MKQDLVVFGVGQIAELALFYFTHDSRYNVKAFTVDGAFVKETSFHGLPVVATDEIGARFPPASHKAFVAVSYAKLNLLRAEKIAALKDIGYEIASYVSSKATTFPDFSAGPNAFILEDNTIQPYVKIGSGVTLWSGNHIGHHSRIGDNVFLASQIVVSGNCTIKDRSFIGVNATLRDGVTIGERCVIGMGAYVAKDCEDETVLPGGKTDPSPIKSSRLKF